MKQVDFMSALAFYPIYGAAGLALQVVYPRESVVLEITLPTAVRQACRSFALDRKALSNAAKFVSGRPHLTPLPLCLDRTFGPLKVHTPKVPGDPAYGYFLIQSIVRIEKSEEGSLVLLKNGVSVSIAQARNVALTHMARAILFERAFWSKRLGTSYYVDKQEFGL